MECDRKTKNSIITRVHFAHTSNINPINKFLFCCFMWQLHIFAKRAQRSPIIIRNSSNPSSRKNLDVRPYDRPYKVLLLACAANCTTGTILPLRNGRAKEKVMRRRNCARNLDTPLVCARKHRQMTMKCAYSSVELQCSVPRAHG